MPTQTLAPDAILDSTNLSGSVSDIDEPVYPDAANLTALFLSDGTGTLRGSPSDTEQSGDLVTVRAALIGGGDTSTYIKQWDDLSGNGRHATRTALNQPLFVTNAIGSRHGLSQAADARILLAPVNPLVPSSVYIVCKPSALATQQVMSNLEAGGVTFALRSDGAFWVYIVEDNLAANQLIHSSTYSAGQTLVLGMAFDGSSVVGNVNGVESSNTPELTIATGSTTSWIGSAYGGSEPFVGGITAIAVYNVKHDATQRAAVVAWLTASYT